MWFTDEAVAAWPAAPRTTRGGQPSYSPLAIMTALTLRPVFRLAYSQAEGLIASIISLLGLALRVPDHTTLSRRSATLTVPRPQPENAGDDGAPPLHLGGQHRSEVVQCGRMAGREAGTGHAERGGSCIGRLTGEQGRNDP